MTPPRASHRVKLPSKTPTGITGLDEITGGGFPRGRSTLLVGGSGSGKTVLGLQFLAHGARSCKEPGIFVGFEETAKRIVANASSFGWKLGQLRPRKLFFLDALPKPDLIQSGDFDLSGMLAALEAQAKRMKARRIVFDALDVLLELLPDTAAKRREVYRLHEWLLASGMTGLITLKAREDQPSTGSDESFGFMHFMVDCTVILEHRVVAGVSQRTLRVQKYRGSGYDENESPFLIGKSGLEVVAAHTPGHGTTRVTKERVSSGVERLDTMLGGGYYRNASVLISGSPGTAKTTLSAAFAEAACERGDRTMFVSFDSECAEVVRNLASVGIKLQRHLKTGCLRMISARATTGSAETYLVRIKTLAQEHRASCLVIDPISTWSRSGNDMAAHSVAERLIEWSKAAGITLVCTKLLDEMFGQSDAGTQLQVSTLADTWIHLNYLAQAGERNRGLSIIKSRGSAHSNQVRELILSDAGVTLTDTYSAGGEVLMGTLRWEKERSERVKGEAAERHGKLRSLELAAEEAELEVRVKSLQTELHAKQLEKASLARSTESSKGEQSRGRSRIRELRGADESKQAKE